MSEWILLITFTTPVESAVVCSRLASEGIEYFLQDELTTQVQPFYSNAVGGVKLKVLRSDYERAIEILIADGYIEPAEEKDHQLILVLKRIGNGIPVFRSTDPLKKLGLIFIGIVVIILVSATIFSDSVLQSRIEGSVWCLRYINHDGRKYYPLSGDYIYLTGPGICNGYIDFREDGVVELPGAGGEVIYATWQIENDMLLIDGATDQREFYNGIFEISKVGNEVIFFKDRTDLVCVPVNR